MPFGQRVYIIRLLFVGVKQDKRMKQYFAIFLFLRFLANIFVIAFSLFLWKQESMQTAIDKNFLFQSLCLYEI